MGPPAPATPCEIKCVLLVLRVRIQIPIAIQIDIDNDNDFDFDFRLANSGCYRIEKGTDWYSGWVPLPPPLRVWIQIQIAIAIQIAVQIDNDNDFDNDFDFRLADHGTLPHESFFYLSLIFSASLREILPFDVRCSMFDVSTSQFSVPKARPGPTRGGAGARH